MTWHPWGDGVVLRPRGDLIDGPACDDLERTLAFLLRGRRRVILSLSDTGQLTARALGVIAQSMRMAGNGGGRLGVCCARSQHRWILEKTHLTPTLGLYETEAAAYAAIAAPTNGHV